MNDKPTTITQDPETGNWYRTTESAYGTVITYTYRTYDEALAHDPDRSIGFVERPA